jgi:hypothetical protein
MILATVVVVVVVVVLVSLDFESASNKKIECGSSFVVLTVNNLISDDR